MNDQNFIPESNGWQSKFEAEINQAEKARLSGNEGMARVCARRAAGIIAGEYLKRHQNIDPGLSAYGQLKKLSDYPDLPTHLRDISEHFLLRVTTDWRLPNDVDLISDARKLAEGLSSTRID